MEITSNPFYELRSRLYASAAAGCSLAAEDFRLKRALDAFEPMSKANKVFGKLYAMCSEMISSPEPQKKIFECLALADALAVTQGAFQDNSETKSVSCISDVRMSAVSYRIIQHYKHELKKLVTTSMSYVEELNSESFRRVIRDPRILSSYIDICSYNGSDNSIDGISRIFEEIYGETLIPLLEKSINLENKNATGNQIKYIFRIAGTSQNDLYVRFAQNEDAPANVRIQAITAMSALKENEKLLETLYKTSRGNIKKAALVALSKMNSEIAVPILEKKLSKFSSENVEYVSVSSLPICMEYAKKVYNAVNIENVPEVKEKHSYSDALVMIANKEGMEEYIEKAVLDEVYTVETFLSSVYKPYDKKLNDTLKKIYEKHHTEKSAQLRFMIGLFENPDEIIDIMGDDVEKYDSALVKMICSKYGYNYYSAIDGIRYLPDGKYHINMLTGEWLEIFDSIPDGILNFISSTNHIYDELSLRKEKLKSSERDRIRDATLKRMVTLKDLVNSCAPADAEKVKKAAEKYASAMLEVYPTNTTVDLLYAAAGEIPKGTIAKFITSELKHTRKAMRYYTLKRFELPVSILLDELRFAEENLAEIAKGLGEELIEEQIKEIKRCIENY